MGSSSSNTANVPDQPSPLPKAWLAELHKDFEAKVKATEQHEQLQAAARSKPRPKKRKSAQPVNSRKDVVKPLTISTATSADAEVTQRQVTKAHEPKQKHKTKHTKHNDIGIKANSVLVVHKDTSVASDSDTAVTEKHQALQEGFLAQLLRRKNDEQHTIQSEDEHEAQTSHSKMSSKKPPHGAMQEKPATGIFTAPDDNNTMISVPLPTVAKAQEAFTIPHNVPAVSRPEQSVFERHKTTLPGNSLTATPECPGVRRPSTPDLHITKVSMPRYDVDELKVIGKSCLSGRFRMWDAERDLQHVFTKSSAVTLRAFSQYQSTLDQPAVPFELSAQQLDSVEGRVNDRLMPYGRGMHSNLNPSHVDSRTIAAVDSWTSLSKNHNTDLKPVEQPPVPIVILGLTARASARTGLLQTEVPANSRSEGTTNIKAAVQPPNIGTSRRNKGRTIEPKRHDKLRYKPGEKAPEFLDLPFEVQTTILEYALLQNEHIHVDALFRTLNKKPGEFRRRGYGALFVCHHFHKIGREAYYAINTFTMSLGLWISLEKLMTRWPNIPRYANNIQPALLHMKHIIVAQLGPGEHGSKYGLWRHLVQFLRPFQHLTVVEIDFREPEYGGRVSDGKNDKVVPVTKELRLRLQSAGGIRIGWTKKEGNMIGIKEGALVYRTTRSQTGYCNEASIARVVNDLQ